MRHCGEILGHERDLPSSLHREVVLVTPDDAPRHRFRAVTDHGVEVTVALPRTVSLFDGAVIHRDLETATIVRLQREQWTTIVPDGVESALLLGHRAGHLHWPVRFEGASIAVRLERDEIIERIEDLAERLAIT